MAMVKADVAYVRARALYGRDGFCRNKLTQQNT